MHNLSAVESVLQHEVQGSPGEGLVAEAATESIHTGFASYPVPFKLGLEGKDRAERRVAPVDVAHALRLGLVHDELPVLHVVAKRRQAPHPHASLLGCGNLVADTLPGDLALELGKGEQHV